jgi:hypothetical protein
MLRKIMIALAATAFVGAMAAATTAEARMGGFGGGGFHGGGFHGGFGGGGFRGGFAGGGFRGGMTGFRGGFAGRPMAFRGGFAGRPMGFRPGFAPRFNRFAFANRRFAFAPRFHRFHNRRFAFAAAPFIVGAAAYPYYYSSYYDDGCIVARYTPWGLRYVNVCGYGYGYY